MFTSIFGAVAQEPEPEQAKEEDNSQGDGTSDAPKPAAAAISFDIWGVAAAVSKSVKQRADELVKSVQETDWKSELSSFSKGVSEDTKTLTNKTAQLVEQLPEVVESLPEKAAAVASQIQAGAAEAVGSRSSDPGGMGGMDMDHTLENVGDSLSQFGRSLFIGTKELIEQVRDGIEEEIAAATKENKRGGRATKSSAAAVAQKLNAVQTKYSRLDAEVTAMQRDSSTYLDEPEDEADFEQWSATFSLDSVQQDIDRLLAGNSFMSELHSRIVPAVVENQDFWTRYFYRLHKLQFKEEQRSLIAQRAQHLTTQEDDELAWDDLDPDTEPTEAEQPAQPAAAAAGPAAAAPAAAVSTSPVAAVAAAEAAAPSPSRAVEREEAVPGAAGESPRPAVATSGVESEAGAGPELRAEEDEAERQASTHTAVPAAGGGEGARSQGGHSNSSGVEVSEADAVVAETASESSVGRAEWCVVNKEAGGEGEQGVGAKGQGGEEVEAEAAAAGEEVAEASPKVPPKKKAGAQRVASTEEEDLDWGNWD